MNAKVFFLSLSVFIALLSYTLLTPFYLISLPDPAKNRLARHLLYSVLTIAVALTPPLITICTVRKICSRPASSLVGSIMIATACIAVYFVFYISSPFTMLVLAGLTRAIAGAGIALTLLSNLQIASLLSLRVKLTFLGAVMIGFGLSFGFGPLICLKILPLSDVLPFILISSLNMCMIVGIFLKWNDEVLQIRDSQRRQTISSLDIITPSWKDLLGHVHCTFAYINQGFAIACASYLQPILSRETSSLFTPYEGQLNHIYLVYSCSFVFGIVLSMLLRNSFINTRLSLLLIFLISASLFVLSPFGKSSQNPVIVFLCVLVNALCCGFLVSISPAQALSYVYDQFPQFYQKLVYSNAAVSVTTIGLGLFLGPVVGDLIDTETKFTVAAIILGGLFLLLFIINIIVSTVGKRSRPVLESIDQETVPFRGQRARNQEDVPSSQE